MADGSLSLDDLDRMLGGAPPRAPDRPATPKAPPQSSPKSGAISLDDINAALNQPPQEAAPRDGIGWNDLGQTLKAGAGDVVQGVGWLGKQVGLPDGVEQYGREMSQNAEAAMSPAAREAMGKEFITDGPDGLGLGPALTDPAAIGLTALRSAPSMAAMMLPGAGAARGVQMAGRGLAAVAPRAGALLSRPFVSGAIGYGGAEGALTGGQDAAQSEQAVLNMPIETLRTSPEFQGLVEQTGSEDAARQKLAADIASGVAWQTGVVTGILGGVAGGGLEHLIQGGARGVLRSAGKQALTEAATEAPQSAAEQLIQNAEESRADPSRPLGQGVANQAVAGGLVGGLTGGALGGGAAAISPRTKAGRAQAEALANTALPGEDVVGSEPAPLTGPVSVDALNEMLNSPPGPVRGSPAPVSITLGQAATEADQAAADRVAPAMQAEADRLAAEQDRIDALNAKAAAARDRRERPARQAADIAAIKAAGEDLTGAAQDFAARVAEPAFNPADEEPPGPVSAPTPPPAPPSPPKPALDQIDTAAADTATAQWQASQNDMLAGRDAFDTAQDRASAARREAERPAREKAAATALRQDAKITEAAQRDYARQVRQGPQFDPAEYQSPIRFEKQAGPPVGRIDNIDPATLTFREKDQERLDTVRDDFRPGDGYTTIVTIAQPDGEQQILDGHHRSTVAMERGDTVPATAITADEYKALRDRNYDDQEIAYAALTLAGDEESASSINRQWPGADVMGRGDRAADLLDSMRGMRFERSTDTAEGRPQEGVAREDLGDGAVVAEYEPAPELVAKREAVARNIGMLVARMTGDRTAAVRVADRLTSLGQDVTGAMIPLDRLVAVSMASPDPVGTARHETLHLLREIGAISEADWSTLSRAAEREGWLERHDIDRRYPSLDREARVEEAVASAFADYRRGQPTGIAAVDRIFNAIAKFLDRVAGAVRAALGREASATDLFRRIEGGKMTKANEAPRSQPVRFERGEVETAQDRQQTAQGWLAKGQPIDRALRLPFDFFGGLTPDGQWKPGIRLTKAAKRIITEARFSDRSSFRFMNDWIHQARAGLIDRYGLSDEYITRDRRRERDERKTLMQGADFLKAMADREMTPAEARALHGALVGDGIASGDWDKLATPIRQAIDELGAEAVELGLVSPESFERNRGTYLHRSYLKHEAEQSGLARMASAFMGSRRKKIIGDQLKGRGMFLEVLADRLPDGADGIGDRVRVADLLGDDGKVKRRRYLTGSAAVPDGYTDKGVWQVRQGRGDRAVIWRDFTKAERERMGEILDARYAIGKTYLTMAHDLATGRFYRDIAANPEWSQKEEPPEGTWKDAGEIGRFKRDPDITWVKVPDTAIAQTGGKKRWGALSGRFVRAEIWADINELAEMQRSTFWRTILRQWKANHTARSPGTHMRNVISNVIFADLADVRWQDMVAGVRMLAGQNQDYRDAVEHGAFGSDAISQDMRKNVLEPLLKELAAQGAGGGVRGRFAMINAVADKIWGAVKAADEGMMKAYQLEDDVFRAAAYMRRRALGDSAEAAGNFARDQFLDYDIRAPWVQAARNSLLPFISYSYRAVPVIARSIATRPWKMAKYATLAYAANTLFRGIAGDSPEDEDRQRRSMREDERAWLTILGIPVTPRQMRMPLNDPTGSPIYLDTKGYLPAGDVFDTSQGQAPIPAAFQFGGPLAMGAEAALNKTAFDGKEIFNKLTDSPTEIAGKYAAWLWKSWMPTAPWIPGSWYWTKIAEAADGVRDRSGKQYSVPSAVASSIGVKLKPQDIEQNFSMRAHEYDRVARDLAFEVRTIARDQERGALSPAAAERAVAKIVEKRQQLAERRQETFR